MGIQLASVSNNKGLNISYNYNDSGVRTSKTANVVTTNYPLVGDKVTYEANSTYYIYDSDDNLVSMNLNCVE